MENILKLNNGKEMLIETNLQNLLSYIEKDYFLWEKNILKCIQEYVLNFGSLPNSQHIFNVSFPVKNIEEEQMFIDLKIKEYIFFNNKSDIRIGFEIKAYSPNLNLEPG